MQGCPITKCRYCNGDEYKIFKKHLDKNGKEVVDAIKCTKCGKVYYTLDKLIYDKNKTIKGRNNG